MDLTWRPGPTEEQVPGSRDFRRGGESTVATEWTVAIVVDRAAMQVEPARTPGRQRSGEDDLGQDRARDMAEQVEQQPGGDVESLSRGLMALGRENEFAWRLSAVHFRRRKNADVSEVCGAGAALRRAGFHGLAAGAAFDARNGRGLGEPAGRRRLRATVDREKLKFLIDPPMCKAFSQLQTLRAQCRGPVRHAKIVAEGISHLKLCAAIGAWIWGLDIAKALERLAGVASVVCHQCAHGATAAGVAGDGGPGRCPSQSAGCQMQQRSWRSCPSSYMPEIIGMFILRMGERARGKSYPEQLVNAILRGIRKQLLNAQVINNLEMGLNFDELEVKVERSFQPREGFEHRGEHAGLALDSEVLDKAMTDDLVRMGHLEVWRPASVGARRQPAGREPIPSRRVNCNKADDPRPELRVRLVVPACGDSFTAVTLTVGRRSQRARFKAVKAKLHGAVKTGTNLIDAKPLAQYLGLEMSLRMRLDSSSALAAVPGGSEVELLGVMHLAAELAKSAERLKSEHACAPKPFVHMEIHKVKRNATEREKRANSSGMWAGFGFEVLVISVACCKHPAGHDRLEASGKKWANANVLLPRGRQQSSLELVWTIVGPIQTLGVEEREAKRMGEAMAAVQAPRAKGRAQAPMPKAGNPEKEAKKAKRRTQNDFDVVAFLKKALGGIAALVAVLLGVSRLSGRTAASASPSPISGRRLPPIPAGIRPAGCANSLLNATGTKESVSIIIPYYHEELFRIEITMQSILLHTDMNLVKEIMWISDGNGPAQIFREELLAMHPKVSVHVNVENKGLIVTKMEAAARAKGSILMFTEPHTVANKHWLEPLLDRLAEEPNALVMPTLDAINGDMTNYHQMQFGHWRFEWNMNLGFTNPWQTDMTKELGARPYPSPATSGGIYAIRKEWWDHLELFDPELIRWGGDHIEASHKVWRCGGRVEMHPCSRSPLCQTRETEIQSASGECLIQLPSARLFVYSRSCALTLTAPT
ncbi:unnamed protein product [Prorocentrum cordatum]|uniref:Glycosyltransferase 2-like domain-containing protein n=1 Tax=Prorocentrum cordatum TaxID=2364126 RepID=A0ABN9VBD1_9DINO|nr:unnamed protein product [Polarella glacialis]